MKQRSRHAGCDVTRWPTSRGIVSSVNQCVPGVTCHVTCRCVSQHVTSHFTVTTTNLFPVSVRVASHRSGGSRPGVAGTLYFSIKRRYTPAAVLLHVVRCAHVVTVSVWCDRVSISRKNINSRASNTMLALEPSSLSAQRKSIKSMAFPVFPRVPGWLAGWLACWLCVSAFCCWFFSPVVVSGCIKYFLSSETKQIIL